MISARSVPMIDPALSINAIVARWPAAVSALNAAGVDTCCGGGDSLSVAAAQAGIPIADLIDAITSAITAERVER